MRLHEMAPPIWLLICIREVPDSIFALDTNYPEVLLIVIIHARQMWRHYRFLPHPFCFQFTNHPIIRPCIRRITDNTIK